MSKFSQILSVLKILFKNKTAVGIEVEEKNKKISYFANKEILLSAGSINSPKILKLSGIGDAQELKKYDIEIINMTFLALEIICKIT